MASIKPSAPRIKLEAPRIVTVFAGFDGELHHARCRRPLGFLGRRGGIELDFYCLECHEHISLPLALISRVPVDTRDGDIPGA